MNALPKHRMTVDEFLRWAGAQPQGRYELHDGQLVMQQAERNAHLETKAFVWLALRNSIRERGLPCHAVPDGASVRISTHTVYEPDALVYCGQRLPADAIEFPDPVILVEVLSPTSQNMDMREKLRDYFTLPGVQHYLIVDPETRLVIHHARGEGDVLLTRLVSQGAIHLSPPGISLDIADIFPGVVP